AAFRRELQRVPNQIRENLFELERIGSDISMRSLQPEVDSNPRPLLLALEILECKADHLVRVHHLELQPRGIVRKMGEAEQLVDHMHKSLNIAADERPGGFIELRRPNFLFWE